MVELDIDLDGLADVEQELESLRDRWTTNQTWSVGSDVEYAIVLEMGRGPIIADEGYLKFEVDGETIFRKSVSGHPPYPWFRPAVNEFIANPDAFIAKNTELDSLTGVSSAEELLQTIAFALQSQMRANASAQSHAVSRSPGTHPEHPQRDSGNLVARIQAIRVR